MSRTEALEKLKELQKNNDCEEAHLEADNILCDLLITLGYSNVIDEYHKVCKWYA